MRMKGIVLDIDEQGAIVIDNEGKYTKIKYNDQLVTGVLVEYTEKDVVGLEKKPILSLIRGKGKFIYPAACAAILVLVIGIFGIFTNKSVNSTFAYIDVDINPSIELKVNQDECIIGVKTLNKDAEKLCENIDFIGKKAEYGVVDIINKSLEMGYFKDDKKFVMVAGALKVNGKLASDKYEKLNDKMGSLIQKIKNKVNSGKEDVELVAFHTSPLKLKEAQKKNISLGRYSIYANAENEGIKIDLDDAKKLKISELFNLLPENDFTYFEEVQRQAAIDVKLIKEEGKDKNKAVSSVENTKKEKADQVSNNKGLNKNKHNIGTSKPDEEDIKNTPEPSATTSPSKNSNKDTKNNDNRETSNNNMSNDDSNSTTDSESTTSENNNERSDNANSNNTDNNNSSNSNTVEKDAQNNNNSTQNNGQSNNSSNSTESNNNNGNDKKNENDNGKSHGNNNKNTTNDIESTPTPIVEANNTTTSIVHPTKAQTPEVTQNTPAPVQTPSPVTIESSATVDNTNKNDSSKNDSAPGQVKKETKTENVNQNKNKNR